MIVFRSLIAAALLAGAANAAPRLAPEDEIAKALAGRSAGEPTDCITLRNIRSTTVVDGTAILYRMSDGTIYLNRPSSGATSLNGFTVLVTDTRSPRLCRIDIVRLIDNATRIPRGTLGLGEFVPYRTASKSATTS